MLPDWIARIPPWVWLALGSPWVWLALGFWAGVFITLLLWGLCGAAKRGEE